MRRTYIPPPIFTPSRRALPKIPQNQTDMTTIEIMQVAVRIYTCAAFAATSIVLIKEVRNYFKETNYK